MKTPVVVSAFCRPDLTRDAVLSLLTFDSDIEVTVSQDGKIPGFYEREHYETREVILELQRLYPQISINLRDQNQGLTQHLIQIFERVLQNHDKLIFLEEDMRITAPGLIHLKTFEEMSAPGHNCAFSTSLHPTNSNELDYRLTFFPEQWGIGINSATFSIFKEVVNSPIVHRDIVRQIIKSTKHKRIQIEFLTDYWVQLFKSEISSAHGWDAALQYALWKYQVPSKVSLKTFIRDLGGGVGALTSRLNSNFSDDISNHEIRARDFCYTCERLDYRRRNFSVMSQVRSRLRIRSRILRNFAALDFR